MFAPVTRKNIVEKLLRGEFSQIRLFRKIGFKGLENSLRRLAAIIFGFYLPRQKFLREGVLAGDNRRKNKLEKSAVVYSR